MKALLARITMTALGLICLLPFLFVFRMQTAYVDWFAPMQLNFLQTGLVLPAFFLFLVLCATTGLHLVFASQIVGSVKSTFSFLQLTDYIWYSCGALFVGVSLYQIQIAQMDRQLEYATAERDKFLALGNDRVLFGDACRLLETEVLRERDNDFYERICSVHFVDNHFVDLYALYETCTRDGSFFGFDVYPAYPTTEYRSKAISEALNRLDSACVAHSIVRTRNLEIREWTSQLRKGENRVGLVNLLKWNFLFAFAIGLKLTKTTAGFAREMRKARN